MGRIVVKIKKGVVLATPASVEPTREEEAVVAAIGQLIRLWVDNDKVIPDEFCKRDWVMGDPLRYFYSDRPIDHLVGLPEN